MSSFLSSSISIALFKLMNPLLVVVLSIQILKWTAQTKMFFKVFPWFYLGTNMYKTKQSNKLHVRFTYPVKHEYDQKNLLHGYLKIV